MYFICLFELLILTQPFVTQCKCAVTGVVCSGFLLPVKNGKTI